MDTDTRVPPPERLAFLDLIEITVGSGTPLVEPLSLPGSESPPELESPCRKVETRGTWATGLLGTLNEQVEAWEGEGIGRPQGARKRLGELRVQLNTALEDKDDESALRKIEAVIVDLDKATEDTKAGHDGAKAGKAALDRVAQAIGVWTQAYGDPPRPTTEEHPREQLAAIVRSAGDWLTTWGDTASEAEKKQATGLHESARVLTARLELAGKAGAYRPVDVTPILAWSWCDKNVERGALRDVLKATLPPFEAAVKAFHRAPGSKTHTALGAARTTLERGLAGAVEHYTKKATSPEKAKVATALLAEARRQAEVIAGLAGRMGELDPGACKTRGAKVLTDRLTALGPTAQETFTAAMKKAETDRQNLESDARRNFLESAPRLAEEKYQRDLERIAGDTTLDDQKREAARKEALAFRDNTIQKGKERYEAYKQGGAKTESDAKEAALLDLGVALFSWGWCKDNLPKKGALYKALESALPAYEAARTKLGQGGATPATHAAAWKALQAVEKKLGGAIEGLDKILAANDKATDPHKKALAEKKVVKRFLARVGEEKHLLEAVEAELPQGKLAGMLAETEQGRATLDAWVEDLGGQASTDDDKAMVRTAMKARFQITRLDGDMTTKALPKLYKVLGMVPERQTRGNPVLNRVERDRSVYVPSGFYNYDEEKGDGVISMSMPRTGNTGLMKKIFGGLLPLIEKPADGWEGSGVKKSESKIIFSHLTLHEIGHSVDEQLHFMDSHMGDAKYGDWRDSSRAEVMKVAGEQLGFYTTLDAVKLERGATAPGSGEKTIGTDAGKRKEFLDEYMALVLDGKDPKEKLEAKAGSYDVPWKALAGHAATSFLEAAKMADGTFGEVTQWDEKARNALAGGRVYQEAYQGTWYSYDPSARTRRVGGYQFRAPGEWFSELYACYYGGRLESSHPDYAWVKALVANE